MPRTKLPPSKPAALYCLRCGTRLGLADDNGFPRPTCPRCGFIYYRNPAPAAGVIVVAGDTVLLVKRRFEPRAGTWCLPSGFMEYGETPEQCASRELREETGLGATMTRLFGVYAGLDDPRVRAVLIVYVAGRTRGALTPGDDAIEARYFPLARLPGDIAFEAHRVALRELKSQRRAAASAAAKPKPSATPPRPARAARPRSRRA